MGLIIEKEVFQSQCRSGVCSLYIILPYCNVHYFSDISDCTYQFLLLGVLRRFSRRIISLRLLIGLLLLRVL